MSAPLCECEHRKHGEACERPAAAEVVTDYGTFRVCSECESDNCLPIKSPLHLPSCLVAELEGTGGECRSCALGRECEGLPDLCAFKVENTGGDCYALTRYLADGSEVQVTGRWGDGIPHRCGAAVVGLYGPDGGEAFLRVEAGGVSRALRSFSNVDSLAAAYEWRAGEWRDTLAEVLPRADCAPFDPTMPVDLRTSGGRYETS